MRPVETLFLDAGGVIVHPNWVRVADELVRHGEEADARALERADRAVRHATDTVAGSRHASDDARVAAYLEAVLGEAGVRRSPAAEEVVRALRAYHAEHNLWETVSGEAQSALGRLRPLVDRMVVVSNANGTLRDHLARLGLLGFFDLAVDSHDEGVEKPDPRLFEAALRRSGARASTTMHVGDLYHVDVVGARLAGLRPVLFDPGGLYADADCERVSSLHDLADRLGDEAGPLRYA